MIGLFLGVGLISSCQSEIDEAKGYGYLQLSSVDVNKSVTTRADITESEAIAVDILDESNAVIQHADDWRNLDDVLLRVATYTIKAYSADKVVETQGFDALPYYEGQSSVLIEANKAKSVKVACKLAQTMVSVSCSETFKSTFAGYTCYIEGADALSIPFIEGEERAAYVKAGQALTVKVDFGNGKSFSQQIASKAEAAYHYKVNLDITEGNAGFDISVDQTIHQYDVTVKVPTKQESADMVTSDIKNDASKVWGQFAYLSGTCNLEEITSPVQFRYKKKADAEWTTIEAVQEEGTKNYSVKVAPLDFGTEYEYYILCGDKTGETCTFTTESYVEIPNLNFDTWSQNGKNWYPNADASNSYWSTGNEGVTLGGNSNSVGVSDSYSGLAAQLQTVQVKVLIVKVTAAGNIFIGNYKTNTSNPASSVSFGRDYTGARPTKLSGYFKYQPGATMSDGSVPSEKLEKDECDIYIQLWSGGETIGEGHFITNETVSEYTHFEIPIEYTVTNKRPDKIAIVATSSRYGGYFDGMNVIGQLAIGSTLWVDDFELSYY
ncbi:PCMD domain-containing protein [Phocaeicola coprocola]|uniref:PCMD domain-containing protein n=1 Tax=Phocaeicola coprocola TaxID=310298 RepID=UPI00402A46F5